MEGRTSQVRRFLYLSIPLLLLFVLSASLLYYISDGSFFSARIFLPLSAFFAGSFIFSLILQAYIFKQKILSRLVELEKVRQIVAEQEKGAQLLVRRDLELTRANERLRKLDEIKSGFISVVAHQLRTPLSGIKWTLNLLLNGDMGPLQNEQKTFLLKAYESNDRMIALVNDMLGADRIESGKVRYSFASVDLRDMVDSILFELLPQAQAKGVSIHFAARSESLLKVRADPEKMRAVFQNLLDNSIKYSLAQGNIEIGMKPGNHDEVLVWVKDDGIGIPKEQQKNVFERFFRAKNAVKAETDGSGLGLFIVRSIIERHGGRIWFESAEGKGVTFYFTVPVDKSDAAGTSSSFEKGVDGL